MLDRINCIKAYLGFVFNSLFRLEDGWSSIHAYITAGPTSAQPSGLTTADTVYSLSADLYESL